VCSALEVAENSATASHGDGHTTSASEGEGTADEAVAVAQGRHTVPPSDAMSTLVTVRVRVVCARGLKKMDRSTGRADPYIVLRCDGRDTQHKTHVVKKSLAPRWDATFTFEELDLNSTLTAALFDWDRFTKDSPMGQVRATNAAPPGVACCGSCTARQLRTSVAGAGQRYGSSYGRGGAVVRPGTV
jgi:hypothetical protein